MFYVVTYDIASDRHRTKIAKILKDFGDRVQYSVFECNLTDSEYTRLQKKLARHVEQGDSIRYYMLCGSCKEKVEIVGEGAVTRDKEYYIA
ncbi:MAG: CRISPR-associated endonuclease Cas2 [Bacteroidota bacterium]|nr:CRISPR-associated endonuclease Cas2 [Bacteroidota bacterium]